MGDVNIGEVSAPAGPLFRSKKRKIYRQRAQSPPVEVESVSSETKLDTPVSVSTGSENQHSEVEYDEDSQRSVAEALRLRKLRKHKVGGVKFQVATAAHVEESQALTTVPAQAEEGGLNVQRRFVGQTGTVAEVDKHM